MTGIDIVIYTTITLLWCISPMIQDSIRYCYENDDNNENYQI